MAVLSSNRPGDAGPRDLVKIDAIEEPIWITLLVADVTRFDCLLGNNSNRKAGLKIDCKDLTVEGARSHSHSGKSGDLRGFHKTDEMDLALRGSLVIAVGKASRGNKNSRYDMPRGVVNHDCELSRCRTR